MGCNIPIKHTAPRPALLPTTSNSRCNLTQDTSCHVPMSCWERAGTTTMSSWFTSSLWVAMYRPRRHATCITGCEKERVSVT
jgi:hypothetical protein